MVHDKWANRAMKSVILFVVLCTVVAPLVDGRHSAAGPLFLGGFALSVAIFGMCLTSIVSESQRGVRIAAAALLIEAITIVLFFLFVFRYGIGV
jgi:hypothetical protein